MKIGSIAIKAKVFWTALVFATVGAWMLFVEGGFAFVARNTWAKVSIEVRSLKRPHESGYVLAEEPFSAKLRNVESDRVFWLFAEKSIVESGSEVEWVFEPDTLISSSVLHPRIDAFYRVGDRYRTVSTRIEVLNVSAMASVLLAGDSLKALWGREDVANALVAEMTLAGLRIVGHVDGEFRDVQSFAAAAGTRVAADSPIQLQEAVVWPVDSAALLASVKRYSQLWAIYDFSFEGTRDSIAFAKPLYVVDGQIVRNVP